MPSPNEAYDAGDKGEVKKTKDRVRNKREKELNEMRAVLSSYEGRSVLWRILEGAGIYKQSFTGNSTTFFNEGMRKVGLELLVEIDAADSKVYGKMRDEAAERAEGRKL